MFKNQVRWHEGEEMVEVMASFKGFYSFPSIHNVIDMTQIHIQKPKGTSIGDFFFFKSKSYNMQLQVVDNQKKFIDIFVGMPDSMNDGHILKISSLYQRIMYGNMFQLNWGEENIKLYILGDKVYPLLPWLMIPHKQIANVP